MRIKKGTVYKSSAEFRAWHIVGAQHTALVNLWPAAAGPCPSLAGSCSLRPPMTLRQTWLRARSTLPRVPGFVSQDGHKLTSRRRNSGNFLAGRLLWPAPLPPPPPSGRTCWHIDTHSPTFPQGQEPVGRVVVPTDGTVCSFCRTGFLSGKLNLLPWEEDLRQRKVIEPRGWGCMSDQDKIDRNAVLTSVPFLWYVPEY